jgi:hypothetical protein
MEKHHYIKSLCDEEERILSEYEQFLRIFSQNLDGQSAYRDYLEREKNLMRRLKNVRRVLNAFSVDPMSERRDQLLDGIRINMKSLTRSLDIKGVALHDEIGSLNHNNIRLGLRYNRYSLKKAEPGLIDIRT